MNIPLVISRLRSSGRTLLFFWSLLRFFSFGVIILSLSAQLRSFVPLSFSFLISFEHLLLSQRQPINTRRCFSLSKQVVQQFRRFRRWFGCCKVKTIVTIRKMAGAAYIQMAEIKAVALPLSLPALLVLLEKTLLHLFLLGFITR